MNNINSYYERIRKFCHTTKCELHEHMAVQDIPNQLKSNDRNRSLILLNNKNSITYYLPKRLQQEYHSIKIVTIRGVCTICDSLFSDKLLTFNNEFNIYEKVNDLRIHTLTTNTIVLIEIFRKRQFKFIVTKEIRTNFVPYEQGDTFYGKSISFFKRELSVEDIKRNTYFLDCEFVRTCDEKKNGLASVVILNYDGDTIFDGRITPRNFVIDYVTRIHGYKEEDLVSQYDEYSVINYIQKILKGKILIGHGLRNDLKVLQIDIKSLYGIIDMGENTILMDKAEHSGPQIGLKTAAKCILQKNIQGKIHSNQEDTTTIREIFLRMTSDFGLLEVMHASVVPRNNHPFFNLTKYTFNQESDIVNLSSDSEEEDMESQIGCLNVKNTSEGTNDREVQKSTSDNSHNNLFNQNISSEELNKDQNEMIKIIKRKVCDVLTETEVLKKSKYCVSEVILENTLNSQDKIKITF